jgi:hypothetical protein
VLTYKVSGATSLTEAFRVFNNLSETGEYRFTFDLGTATTLKKWLSWQITASDRFVSNPDFRTPAQRSSFDHWCPAYVRKIADRFCGETAAPIALLTAQPWPFGKICRRYLGGEACNLVS